MNAVIWHNPKCGTSQKTLEILNASGADVTVIEYLKWPWSRTKLSQLIRDAGRTPRDMLRLRGTDAEERGLANASDDAIIDAMVVNSAYVERPIVETAKGVRLCRPQDVVREIL